jgi:hypothetical protein
MGYQLEGRVLEVCSCHSICPCWVGQDPDGGKCDGTIAWRIDRGQVDGVDVSGLTLGIVAHIPGNALKGQWRAAVFLDDRASEAQEKALLAAFTGQAGGPLADIASLVGDVVSVERVKIEADVREGSGELRIGDVVHADMEGFKGPRGKPTELYEAVFSFKPGAAAYPGKAAKYRVRSPALGMDVDLQGHNCVQGQFAFSA